MARSCRDPFPRGGAELRKATRPNRTQPFRCLYTRRTGEQDLVCPGAHTTFLRRHSLTPMHSGLVFEHLKECTQLAHERVMQCIQLEREEPMTVNEDTLSDYKSKFLTHYRVLHRTHNKGSNSVLQSFINGAYDGSHNFINAVSNLNQIGFPGLTRQDFLRLLKPDRDDEAMEIMAECRAYYQGTSSETWGDRYSYRCM